MTTPTVAERLRNQVAEEVRSWMARRRMSGVKLAEQIERTQQYVSRRLNGEVAFDLDDLELIAKALHVSVFDLLPRSTTQVQQATGQINSGGSPRTEASVRNVPVPDKSGRSGYPDRVRPRDSRPVGHPQSPAVPPIHRRPVRRPRTA